MLYTKPLCHYIEVSSFEGCSRGRRLASKPGTSQLRQFNAVNQTSMLLTKPLISNLKAGQQLRQMPGGELDRLLFIQRRQSMQDRSTPKLVLLK